MGEKYKELTELVSGETYRLMDEVSFISANRSNSEIVKKYFNGDVICIDEVVGGEGYFKDSCVISSLEMKYFELVTKSAPSSDKVNNWDGVSDIEVGMYVAYDTFAHLVELVGEDHQLVISDCHSKLKLVLYSDVYDLLPDPKVEFGKKMLKQVRGSHMDYMNDTTWDIVKLAELCYEELNNEKA